MTDEEAIKLAEQSEEALKKAQIGEQFHSWIQHPYTQKLFVELEKFRDSRVVDAENQLDKTNNGLTVSLLIEARMIRKIVDKLKSPIEIGK